MPESKNLGLVGKDLKTNLMMESRGAYELEELLVREDEN